MMDLVAALPYLHGVRVDRVHFRDVGIRIEATTVQERAVCDGCRTETRRVHSRYQRRLLDAGMGRREVEIELTVRRFFCDEPTCPRRTFVEQVEALTTRHGRRTQPADQTVRDVGLCLGGRPGARLIAKIGAPVGRMTLLRSVRAMPLPAAATPRVLGVDDFAVRRGHNYGTILIDMNTRRPVDVLPDRSAETLATWLAEHPGVEIICRDRGGSYAEGASRGAPDAIQVADRWHLLHNLSKAVEKAVAPHRRCLREPEPDPAPMPPIVQEPPMSDTAFAQRTRARHADVHAAAGRGLRPYQIAKHLHLDPKTVQRYLAVSEPEDLLGVRGSRRGSVLDSFLPYLLQRCQNGVTATSTLLAEITQQGYLGGERTLRRWLVQVRGDQTIPIPVPVPSARQITAWIMRPTAKLSDDDKTQFADACRRCPDIAQIADLAGRFTTIVRTLAGKQLSSWLDDVTATEVAELRTFANGLRKDSDAVLAGLTMTWSSGAVEGNVNRIKMIKRQMFGRAKFDLLRHRVLAPT